MSPQVVRKNKQMLTTLTMYFSRLVCLGKVYLLSGDNSWFFYVPEGTILKWCLTTGYLIILPTQQHNNFPNCTYPAVI